METGFSQTGQPARGPSPPTPYLLPSELSSRPTWARQSEWTRWSHIVSATAFSATPLSSKSSPEQTGQWLVLLKLQSVIVLFVHPSEDSTFFLLLLGASSPLLISFGRWMSMPSWRIGVSFEFKASNVASVTLRNFYRSEATGSELFVVIAWMRPIAASTASSFESFPSIWSNSSTPFFTTVNRWSLLFAITFVLHFAATVSLLS